MQPTDRPALLQCLLPAVRQAGAAIMAVYATDFAVRDKADLSPVTHADDEAEALLTDALHRLTPGVPVVGEEAAAAGRAPPPADRFWLVDALDGTREFVARNGEFTVNVALIDNGQPVLGVVFAPALGPAGQLFAGVSGAGAFADFGVGQRPIACRTPPAEGLIVLASRSHNDGDALARFLQGQQVLDVRHIGSSIKFGLLAAGQADLYPRFGRTMEWDIAAGDAVLRAAGGSVTNLAGDPMAYGKPGFDNPHFIARGRA